MFAISGYTPVWPKTDGYLLVTAGFQNPNPYSLLMLFAFSFQYCLCFPVGPPNNIMAENFLFSLFSYALSALEILI